MSMVGIAGIIALCAALASATGDVIRQRSAHEITDEQVGHLKLFGMSLRDARWWLGGGAAILNYSLQAVALVWASVLLVTSLQVTALLFALPIHARVANHRITRSDWLWATVLAGALAVVIVVGDPTSGSDRAPFSVWAVVAAVILVACVVAAKVCHGRPVAAVLLALVAGSSLALFAVLTKGVVDVLRQQGFVAAVSSRSFFPGWR
ncbi:MAG: DMT family transporter [Gordonia sp. (in: high G+C Gram-positive bacteria)]